MIKINWARFIVGAVIASIILFMTDGFLHEVLVGSDWKAVYAALGANEPVENPAGMIYFAIFELGRGFIGMFLYVLLRACCKPGPKTAAWAGFVAWLAFSLTGPAQFIPLKFYSNSLWVKVAAFQLVTSVVAAIIAAALYKDAGNVTTA
jgi:hypothetical protein